MPRIFTGERASVIASLQQGVLTPGPPDCPYKSQRSRPWEHIPGHAQVQQFYCNRQSMETTQISIKWMERQTHSVHTMEYYSAINRSEALPHATTWTDLYNTVLGERSHVHELTHCMVPVLGYRWTVEA